MKKLIEAIKRVLSISSKTGSFWFLHETKLEDYE